MPDPEHSLETVYESKKPTLETLPYKEMACIELKYLGNTYPQMEEKIGVPATTLSQWFYSNGKLSALYQEYVIKMNKRREDDMVRRVALTEEEVFVVTTNIWRKLGQRISGRQVPVYDKDGQPVLDKFGNPTMRTEELEVDVADGERAWKMQRIMLGLPTSYEKQEIEQTNFETDVIIKELGLSDSDFEDANLGATTEKIRAYIENK